MGNLEKAGVLVVVALLAVILVVAFLNFPDQRAKAPVLHAGNTKMLNLSELKNTKPKVDALNVYPEPPANEATIKPEAPVVQEDWKILPDVRDGGPADRKVDAPAPVVDSGKNAKPAPPIDVVKEEKPASVTTTPGYPKTVKVAAGDTLWLIAVREYGAKLGPAMLGEIADANPKVRPEALKAGATISLPAPPQDAADAKTSGGAKPEKKAASIAADKKNTPAPPAAPKPARKLPFVPN